MIIIHVDQKEIKKGNDAIVVRTENDFPFWCREYKFKGGRVIQRDKQDEHGASVTVELNDD